MKKRTSLIGLLTFVVFGLSACMPSNSSFFSSPYQSFSETSSSFPDSVSSFGNVSSSASSVSSGSSTSSSSANNSSGIDSSVSSEEIKDITIDEPEQILWNESGGVYSDESMYCQISKGTSVAGGLFSLSQGGLFKNTSLKASAIPLKYWNAISVTFTETSDIGFLTIRGSSFEIVSPENGAYQIENNKKYFFSPDQSSFPYFSLFACVGTFVISSITLYGAAKNEDAQPNFIDFYTINDTHGAADYIPSKYQAGITRLSSYALARERENPENTLFVSSGDMWQGGALSNVTYGEMMVNWMNIVGFESMAIGNHEFDWTADYIARNSSIANFPFLGINILDGDNARPVWAKPSTVVQKGRYRIGIIGAIGQLESSIAVSSLGNYHFASNYPSLISAEATRLRSEENCDLVVLSIHNGSFNTALCQNIDAVFEGHTHQDYENTDAYGIPQVQCYANGSEFQKVHFEEIDGKLKFVNYVCEDFSNVSSSSEEPMTANLYQYYSNLYPDINDVVGHTEVDLSEADLAMLSAKALCEYYQNDNWNSDMTAGILNWGGVRQTIPAGEVTYAQLYAALPFDNDNVLCSFTGDNFKKMFSYSSYLAIYSTVSVSQIVSSATYYAMMISYVSDSSYYTSLFKEIKRDASIRLRDIVAEYFKAGENV